MLLPAILVGGGLLIGAVLWSMSEDKPLKSQEAKTADFQESLIIAMQAVDANDLSTYQSALATAGAQLDVSAGPTLRDEQALGTYQGMLSQPQNYQLKQILSFAGFLQSTGYEFEAGNLVVLASGLVS